jgi:hypothetical protein
VHSMSVILLLYQINIYLFTSSAAAAVHNRCEWSIVLHMAGNHKELKKTCLRYLSSLRSSSLCACASQTYSLHWASSKVSELCSISECRSCSRCNSLTRRRGRFTPSLQLLIQVTDENICLTLRFCPFCMYVL